MKNFQFWHTLKNNIDNKTIFDKEFKVGEIWWCHIGLNVGSEEDGKNENYERPVFIVKKFNRTMFLGIPTSTNIRDKKHYYKIENDTGGFNLNFSQMRVLSSKRLIRMITIVSSEMLKQIISFLKNYI